jgi:tRNA C32,U32 (ribose-2'-O)-methylase TrmJ
MKEHISSLIQALRRHVGNTGHMRTIEAMLERVDVKPEEIQAIHWLARELEQKDAELSRAKRSPYPRF